MPTTVRSRPPESQPGPFLQHRAQKANRVWLMALICLAGMGGTRADDAPKNVDETSKTAEAVIAVDRHWGAAETAADNAYLDELLLPEYRTVNAEGVVHRRSKLPRKPATAAEKANVDAWIKSHPEEPQVLIVGDTAILTWYDSSAGPDQVRSSDIFVYRGGRWHAVYSQHTDLSKSN